MASKEAGGRSAPVELLVESSSREPSSKSRRLATSAPHRLLPPSCIGRHPVSKVPEFVGATDPQGADALAALVALAAPEFEPNYAELVTSNINKDGSMEWTPFAAFEPRNAHGPHIYPEAPPHSSLIPGQRVAPHHHTQAHAAGDKARGMGREWEPISGVNFPARSTWTDGWMTAWSNNHRSLGQQMVAVTDGEPAPTSDAHRHSHSTHPVRFPHEDAKASQMEASIAKTLSRDQSKAVASYVARTTSMINEKFSSLLTSSRSLEKEYVVLDAKIRDFQALYAALYIQKEALSSSVESHKQLVVDVLECAIYLQNSLHRTMQDIVSRSTPIPSHTPSQTPLPAHTVVPHTHTRTPTHTLTHPPHAMTETDDGLEHGIAEASGGLEASRGGESKRSGRELPTCRSSPSKRARLLSKLESRGMETFEETFEKSRDFPARGIQDIRPHPHTHTGTDGSMEEGEITDAISSASSAPASSAPASSASRGGVSAPGSPVLVASSTSADRSSSDTSSNGPSRGSAASRDFKPGSAAVEEGAAPTRFDERGGSAGIGLSRGRGKISGGRGKMAWLPPKDAVDRSFSPDRESSSESSSNFPPHPFSHVFHSSPPSSQPSPSPPRNVTRVADVSQGSVGEDEDGRGSSTCEHGGSSCSSHDARFAAGRIRGLAELSIARRPSQPMWNERRLSVRVPDAPAGPSRVPARAGYEGNEGDSDRRLEEKPESQSGTESGAESGSESESADDMSKDSESFENEDWYSDECCAPSCSHSADEREGESEDGDDVEGEQSHQFIGVASATCNHSDDELGEKGPDEDACIIPLIEGTEEGVEESGGSTDSESGSGSKSPTEKLTVSEIQERPGCPSESLRRAGAKAPARSLLLALYPTGGQTRPPCPDEGPANDGGGTAQSADQVSSGGGHCEASHEGVEGLRDDETGGKELSGEDGGSDFIEDGEILDHDNTRGWPGGAVVDLRPELAKRSRSISSGKSPRRTPREMSEGLARSGVT